MMRRLALMLCLALCVPCMGSTVYIMKKAGGVSCTLANKSDVTLFVNWDLGEEADGDYELDLYNASTNPNGTEWTSGDDTNYVDVQFSPSSIATTTGANLDTNCTPATCYGVELTLGGGAENRAWFRSQSTGNAEFPSDLARVGFLFNIDSTPTGTSTGMVGFGGSNDFRMYISSGTPACVTEGRTATYDDTGETGDLSMPLSTGVDYWMECSYDTSGGASDKVSIRLCTTSTCSGWDDSNTGNINSFASSFPFDMGSVAAADNLDFDLDLIWVVNNLNTDGYTHLITNGCTDYSQW